ncbi:hypothetical protein HPB47_013616 [Ixodes persulcatus]|uniref:Uncharacterized protein n=1 Tax=Ixodes persulcatus TaxID=34615 RepID=A0AC60QY27_IXOPE|nr:hypothetical protein HPB47_013616 [Ixodes persulcatus]
MPKLEAFAGKGGDKWEELVEDLGQHLIAHDVSAAKQCAVFLSSYGRPTYSLLRRLLAPKGQEKSCSAKVCSSSQATTPQECP